MHIPPSEAKALTWWEYTALTTVWNERHAGKDGASEVEPPSDEVMRRHDEMIVARGIGKVLH